MNTGNVWVHCDINSYFATMQQQKYPHLRGKSVAVVKEVGRNCVIAASKEAKRKGIKTGCNLKDARALDPHLIVVGAEFDYYLQTTKKLHTLFQTLVPEVEIFSLDEAFLNLTGCHRIYPSTKQFGQLLQRKIKETLGEVVTCNVGISYNRFLAKLASEVSKPESITEITEENLDDYLTTTEFNDVCGIGFRLEYRLKELGITNLYELNFYSDEFLQLHFGPYLSKQLRKMGRGEEPDLLSSFHERGQMKSVGRSITLWRPTEDEREIKRVFFNLTEEACSKARRMKLAGRYVSVYVRGDDGQMWQDHATLSYYTNFTQEMFSILYYQLYKSWKRSYRIIKFAVRLGMLTNATTLPSQLFIPWQRREAVYKAMDSVNWKYGEYTVHTGTMHHKRIIHSEVTGFLGDKQYQFNFTK